jgi:hypothetical protein
LNPCLLLNGVSMKGLLFKFKSVRIVSTGNLCWPYFPTKVFMSAEWFSYVCFIPGRNFWRKGFSILRKIFINIYAIFYNFFYTRMIFLWLQIDFFVKQRSFDLFYWILFFRRNTDMNFSFLLFLKWFYLTKVENAFLLFFYCLCFSLSATAWCWYKSW